MSKTGSELLQGFSVFLNDWETSTTTSAGNASGGTAVDTYLKRYQDNRLTGRFFRPTTAGTNQYIVQTINGNSQSTGTVTFNGDLPAQVGSSVDYEIHRYDPAKKFRALDQARYDVSDYAFRLIYNELLTGDGYTDVFPIPEEMSMGPITVWEEVPVAALNLIWNFINNALGTDTNYWTECNCTPSIVEQFYTDLVVPKYDWACTRLDVPGTLEALYAQTIDNMANGITASAAAGRKMTAAVWVYCETPDRVYLDLIDDFGTTSSTAHQGKGWELLHLEKEIVNNNSLVLTTQLRITTGDPIVLFWNRWWLYYGSKQRVTEVYTDEAFPTIRRDEATQTFQLTRVVVRGHQLRLIGQEVLSALGNNPSTQVTNTMEVTNNTAEMLYAKAAELLLEWESLTATDVPEVYQRIQTVQNRMKRVDKFRQSIPSKHVNSPYWR